MAKRLTDAGLPPSDVQVIVPPEFPKQGNLVAVLKGSDRKRPAMLLLAHIDVVEARRADWQRDPFKLVEENGYFYARGANDDKAMAAAFVDTPGALSQGRFPPQARHQARAHLRRRNRFARSTACATCWNITDR